MSNGGDNWFRKLSNKVVDFTILLSQQITSELEYPPLGLVYVLASKVSSQNLGTFKQKINLLLFRIPPIDTSDQRK